MIVGGVRSSLLFLSPSDQQCNHSGWVCPEIQGWNCGAYVGAVVETMCIVYERVAKEA